MIVIKLLADCRILIPLSQNPNFSNHLYVPNSTTTKLSRNIKMFMLKIFHAYHVTIFIQWDSKDAVNEFKCPIMSEKVYIYKSTIDI